MGRENKKETIAALHRSRIMKAAEALFCEKGFDRTTIDDISKASEYSRRTIYAYYESKEDILHHIIEQGLGTLKEELERAVCHGGSVIETYGNICAAMCRYHRDYPHAASVINGVSSVGFDGGDLSQTVRNILALGTDINGILTAWIGEEKKRGTVRKDVVPELTVYVLWSSLTSFLTLADTKGPYICRQCSVSQDAFLEYGFLQIFRSILAEKAELQNFRAGREDA